MYEICHNVSTTTGRRSPIAKYTRANTHGPDKHAKFDEVSRWTTVPSGYLIPLRNWLLAYLSTTLVTLTTALEFERIVIFSMRLARSFYANLRYVLLLLLFNIACLTHNVASISLRNVMFVVLKGKNSSAAQCDLYSIGALFITLLQYFLYLSRFI